MVAGMGEAGVCKYDRKQKTNAAALRRVGVAIAVLPLCMAQHSTAQRGPAQRSLSQRQQAGSLHGLPQRHRGVVGGHVDHMVDGGCSVCVFDDGEGTFGRVLGVNIV